jgi:hypothetical protein
MFTIGPLAHATLLNMTSQVSRPSSLTSNVERDLEWVKIVVDCDIDTDIANLKSLIS